MFLSTKFILPGFFCIKNLFTKIPYNITSVRIFLV